MKFSKTRVQKSDVGRYTKVDTGTAQGPVMKSSKVSSTRVESGGVADHDPVGTNARKANTRMKKTRQTSA